jgi:Fe-S cluster assembly protein SufD
LTAPTATDYLTAEATDAPGLPDWMAQRRRAAYETFLELPVPSQEMEDWRRTDVSHIDLRSYRPQAPDAAASNHAPLDEPPAWSGWAQGGERGALALQQEGGTFVASIPQELTAQGVIIASLEEAAQNHSELVRRYLDQEVVPAGAGKFSALNAAFWRGGVFVYVPRGVHAALPVWSAVASGADDGVPVAILPRSLVVVEDGASLVYTDEYASPARSGRALSSAVTEVVLGDGARIQYLVMQRWDGDIDHFATHRINMGRDSSAELVVVTTGAEVSKTYMEVAMFGPGSNARISGLVIGDGRQHFDYQSLQDHHAPNCVSDLLIKTALRDSAVSVYSGLIKIRKDAQHSNAYQANRNLLLSPHAKADSIPKLEIEANDVRCTHGATVGQVDADQLFYLESRGIELREAQNLVVHGFFQPVIDRIALPQVREQIHEAIDAELVGLDPRGHSVSGGSGTSGDEGVQAALESKQ